MARQGYTFESDSASVEMDTGPHSSYRIMGRGHVRTAVPVYVMDPEEETTTVPVSFSIEDDPHEEEDRDPTNAMAFGSVHLTQEKARELGEALIEASEAEPVPLFGESEDEE